MNESDYLSAAEAQLAVLYHMRHCSTPTIVLPPKASLAIEAMCAGNGSEEGRISREALTNEQWLSVVEGVSGAHQLDLKLPDTSA
jgi:hypothetical protein